MADPLLSMNSPSAAFFRDLADNSPALIQSVRPDGSFLFVNRAWCSRLGYRAEEAARLHVLDVVHPEYRLAFHIGFEQLRKGEPLDRLETHFITRDGQTLA